MHAGGHMHAAAGVMLEPALVAMESTRKGIPQGISGASFVF